MEGDRPNSDAQLERSGTKGKRKAEQTSMEPNREFRETINQRKTARRQEIDPAVRCSADSKKINKRLQALHVLHTARISDAGSKEPRPANVRRHVLIQFLRGSRTAVTRTSAPLQPIGGPLNLDIVEKRGARSAPSPMVSAWRDAMSTVLSEANAP